MSIKYKLLILLVVAVVFPILITLGFTRYFSGKTEGQVAEQTEAQVDGQIDAILEGTAHLVDVYRTDLRQQRLTAVRNYLRATAEGLHHEVERLYRELPREESLAAIRSAVLNVKIAETGYAFGMNSDGVLTLHPKSEGKNLSGSGHIDTMRRQKSGFITYHSVTAKRDKAVYYTYFAPLDLILAPGVFVDELESLYDVEGEAKALDAMKKRLETIRVGSGGYLWVVQGGGERAGRYVASPEGKKNGQNSADVRSEDGRPVFRTMMEKATAAPGEITEEWFSFKNSLTGKAEPMLLRFVYYEPLDWLIGASVPDTDIAAARSTIHASFAAMERYLLLIAAVLALAAAAFAWGVASSTVRPIRQVMEVVGEMEQGHLDVRLNLRRTDELGQMGRSIDHLAENLQQEVVGSLQRLAEGDITFTVTPRDERDAVRGAVKSLEEELNVLLSQILGMGEQIASGSTQVADASQSLSQGATEQASSLEEISASMNELGSQTKLNAENAAQASQLSSGTKASAEGGNAKMQQMVAAMAEINEAGQSIGKIIKTIDEIAFQTNLLALNAAVEAARAGQHGKGFAVVAEEVRNLAARSARAARETAELIEGSIRKAENGAGIADETAAALGEIVSGITKVSDLVGEIAAASNEQAQGIGQVNTGLGQIDQVTQQNTASAEQSAAAAQELSGQADELRRMLSRFRLKGESVAQRALPAPKPVSAPTAGGWAQAPAAAPRPQKAAESAPAPSRVIALDDEEFGKY